MRVVAAKEACTGADNEAGALVAQAMSVDTTPRTPRCWCGNAALADFSESYAACAECGTLVSRRGLRPDEAEVRDDEHDFYGKPYWLAHQRDELGFPDIHERARLDLPERCLYWLRTLLAYRLPPARVLELGAGHGAYVALMRAAGYEATGLELSPWVVEFARTTFGVPMLLGPIEAQTLPEDSLDVVVLNDVLEHLVEPWESMRRCAKLLEPDGLVVAQTPCYPDDQTYGQLVEAHHPFLAMLQEREHLYLFSRRAVRRLFADVGLPVVRFEPALFPYDMVVVASRQGLTPTDLKHRHEVLLASPAARLVKAMVDLDDRARAEGRRADEIESDRKDRIAMIDRLNRHIERTSGDHEARRQVVLDQQATIERVAASSEAQVHLIADQQATIEKLIQQRDYLADLEARVKQSRLAWLLRLLRIL
jgi:2-polyprenyl-3-methyl-5-hydroxy-6-metoxy-1,4-benzoquinol methylase